LRQDVKAGSEIAAAAHLARLGTAPAFISNVPSSARGSRRVEDEDANTGRGLLMQITE